MVGESRFEQQKGDCETVAAQQERSTTMIANVARSRLEKDLCNNEIECATQRTYTTTSSASLYRASFHLSPPCLSCLRPSPSSSP